MKSKQEIVIKDACVIFDLIDLGLLTAFFELGYICFTTVQVLAEITDTDQIILITPHIDNGDLKISSDGELESIDLIQEKYPALSNADCSILELAVRMTATVLSSDGSLRRISTANNINVIGLLTIIDNLVSAEVISPELAIEKLNHCIKINDRAPKAEIEAMIIRLKT